jgi:hypothetical protein
MLQYHCMSSHQKKQKHFRSKDVCMSITDLINENMLIVLVIETEKQGSHTEEWNGGQPEEVIQSSAAKCLQMASKILITPYYRHINSSMKNVTNSNQFTTAADCIDTY